MHLTTILRKFLPGLLLFALILLGLYFRISGISKNHSFWNDEALVSSFSRDIVQGKVSVPDGIMKIHYQPLQIGVTAVAFEIFGISEFAARIPSVFFGTLGIVFAYLIGSKLSNKPAGLLSSFIFAFSQINLSNSTQAKPYATLSTLLLTIVYILSCLPNASKRKTILAHISIILIVVIATFIHYLAVTFWAIYLSFVFITYGQMFIKKLKNPLILILSTVFLLIFLRLFRIDESIIMLFRPDNDRFFFVFDNSMYLKNLLIKQYGYIVLPTLAGFVFIFNRNKILVVSIFAWILVLLFMWNFRYYSHNLRYLVPLFGVFFVTFGIFWGELGEKYLKNKEIITCIIVAVLLVALSDKIVRYPRDYYSPNADFYGDVQAANYKMTYAYVYSNLKTTESTAIFSDIIDAHRWYLPQKNIDAYFIKSDNKEPQEHDYEGGSVYKTLNQFLNEKSKYKKGLLIVEDWESILPEDIKQYAKKNLKLEYRVESLEVSPTDKWPIEIYSWGMEEK